MARREAPVGANAVFAWVAVVCGLSAAVAAVAPVGWVPRFLILLAFTCFGPGCAVVCHVRLGDAVAAVAVALALSLSAAATVAVSMVWTATWRPQAATIGLGLATAAGGLLALMPVFAGQGGGAGWARWLGDWRPAAEPSGLTRVGAILTAPTSFLPRIAGAPGRRAEARLPPGRDSGQTVVIPVVRDPSATAVILTVPDPSATVLMPAVRDPSSTAVIPAVRDPSATAVIPAVWDPSATAVLPAVPRRKVALVRPGARAIHRPAIRWGLTHLGILVTGGVLWGYGLSRSDLSTANDYGLLGRLPPAFFAALALCALGFLLELTRARWRGGILLAYLVLLLLIMHATVPLLSAEPEYSWAYRHVGVIEFIRSLGTTDNPNDIYQQWPTFFALVAQLITVSGGHTLTVATWAPLFFDALDCLPLFAIARTLSTDRRVPYLAVVGFTALNWVGQDYLSPQAFVFPLCLIVLLVMLRWLRRLPGRTGVVRPALLARVWLRLQEGLAEVPYTSSNARRVALIVLYLVYAVVVASHQLSPYLIAASAVALVGLGLVRPVRIAPILLGIAIAYVIPRYQVVDSYGIFDGLNFLRNSSGVSPTGTAATAGEEFSAHAVRFLGLSVWGLTVLAVLAARRRLGPVALPAVLAFAPFTLVLVQNYGGEAIYRVYLFSAPWCAYLLADYLIRHGSGHRRAWLVVGTPVLCAMVLASMQGEHGQLIFDQFTVGEVTAAQYLYTNAPDGSAIIYAEQNFPGELTARYGDLVTGRLHESTLLQSSEPGAVTVNTALGPDDVDAILNYVTAIDGTQKFLVISTSMIDYVHYFGYLPDGTVQRLDHLVAGSSQWRLWYSAPGATIYRFVG